MNPPSTDTEALERIIIDALAAVSVEAATATRESEVLQLVDSMGLVMALANVQEALDVSLEPDEIIQVFQCRSIADVAVVLQAVLSARVTSRD
jgi:acyl carrier protein